MISRKPRRTSRRVSAHVAAGMLAVGAVAVTLGYRVLASSSPTTPPPIAAVATDRPDAAQSNLAPATDLPGRRPAGAPGGAGASAPDAFVPNGPLVLRGEHRDGLGKADGLVPASTTVFDGGLPAIAKLDPELLDALRRAARDAAADGVELFVESGWRSPEYQRQLLREAVDRYGSLEEAARWVATVETSPHVSGDAVDIAPAKAAAWLSEHGAGYGLCQIYRNEPWHYELRRGAIEGGCPRMYADPTHDPRMQA